MVPGITQLLDELNAELDELEKKVEPTWHALVEPVERLTDRLSLAWGTVSHLKVITLLLGRMRADPTPMLGTCLCICASIRAPYGLWKESVSYEARQPAMTISEAPAKTCLLSSAPAICCRRHPV